MKTICSFLLFIAALQVCTAQPPARNGRDYAVFFYVTDFQPGWAPLPETALEAEVLKTELETGFDFSCEMVANPTKQQIRQKIREYNMTLTADDQVLYYFSMHGVYVAASDRGYLVGFDGQFKDIYGDSWLSYDELRNDLAPCKAMHILLALDACHSGSFGIRNKSGPAAPAYDQEKDCATRVEKTMRFRGRQYCTSGNKDAKTPARSLFAQRFTEALRKGGDGLILRFDDLEYWLGKVESPKPESGTFVGHEPGGDFVFVRKNACALSAALPDRDGDGVPDAEDKCPDEYGTKAKMGCPEKGDAGPVADADFDGIPDERDGCPTEFGTARANGCPDRDNDGVPDKSDKCPDSAGEPQWQGCPDTDRDGIPDHEDQCPDQRGPAAANGCPPPDRDRDGVPDKADKCPDEAGETYLEGCPDTTNADPYRLIPVKGGAFTMGCTGEQKDCNDDEKPAHQVTLSDFYMGKYEVTQKQWQNVMGSNPSQFKNCDECPVENVSWNDVQAFLKKLNAGIPAGQNPYRLPTEAEWEYAARGGGGAALFGNGKNVADPNEMNFDASASHRTSYSIAGQFRQKTVPVGSLNSPNALGLHDMSGNVWEWCSDWFDTYSSGAQTNPAGPSTGSGRIIRGGAWNFYPEYCRVADRYLFTPGYRVNAIGFRLARSK